jgi:hypothetical protein
MFPHTPYLFADAFRLHILPWLVETTFGGADWDGIVEEPGTIHLHNTSKLKVLYLVKAGENE